MDETTTIQGREITQDDIELVRRLIEANPCRNRTRLSKELCLLWNWRAANGQIKDMACRSLLDLFQSLLYRYHYLGFSSTVGENMKYMVFDREHNPLACLLFGSAAWNCAPRDDFIGWNAETRKANLQFLTHNMGFLILPWVRAPHLASPILGQVARRISSDWMVRYNHPIYL